MEDRRLLNLGDLLQTLTDPNVAPQANSLCGYAVATDGNLTVVGTPGADVGGPSDQQPVLPDAGRAYVFNSSTGALLATLEKPEPMACGFFGWSVAVAGNRVVVGAPGPGPGSAYVFDAATGSLLRTLDNPGPAGYDRFGSSVAVSGNTVVVGVPSEVIPGLAGPGLAYVFDAVTGNLLRTLNNPTPASADQFGSSVAVSGSTVVVGAFLDDTGATNSGSAYVFDAATGTLLRTLNNPTPGANDDFGISVAVSGSTVVVGARFDSTAGTYAGSAYVFDAGTGNLLHALANPAPARDDNFGVSVAVSGSTVAVGAYRGDTGATDAGSAYLFDADTGDLLWTLNKPTPVASDRFGYSVAVSGSTLVVGAYGDDTGATDSGSAYVFDAATGNLLRTLANPTPPLPPYFGYSVAASGSTLVAGVPNDDAIATDSGSAYVFDAATGNRLLTLNNPTPSDFDIFGSSVAVSGTTVVVGAPSDDTGATNAGSAYVFDAATGSLLRTLNNPTPAEWDDFGSSVAVSGSTVVVGAYGDDTGATDAGSAYIFDAATGNLLLTLNNPTPADSDYFGFSVAVSGSTVVVGAYGDHTVGTNPGSAYVFDAPSGNLLRTLNNPTPAAGDAFGASLAVSGNTAVVGAPYDDTGATDAGSTYIFDVATGNLLLTLNNPTPAARDNYGFSVAVSGSTLVVGAPQDDTGATDAGSAYAFDVATGILLRTLNNPTPAPCDYFGHSVAMSGTQALIGAPFEDTITVDRGAAYVFDVNRAPTSVELLDTSDTGISSTDNVTGLDNSTGAGTLQFAVSNTIPDATVTIYTDGTAIGSATATGTPTTVTTDGSHDLADGRHRVTARQTEPGNPESGDSPASTITVHTTAPSSADVVDVTPDPRTNAVASINIVFSEAVYGFDKADLSLTRNGGAVALTVATLETTDNTTWTLGNLASLTGTLVNGTTTNYVLRLTAAGSGITDLAGNALAADASDAWIVNPTAFNGTANGDTFEFIAAGAVGGLPTMHQLKVTLAGSPTVTYYYDAAGSVSLSINAGAGSDSLTITGGPGTDTSTIYRYRVSHTGPGTAGSPGYYCVSASNIETIRDYAGPGAGQRITFYDGPDSGDVFTARADLLSGWMHSATGNPNSYSNYADGYDQIYGASTAGGVDEAVLYGSDGNDSMRFEPGYTSGTLVVPKAYITRPGAYFIYAQNFKKITGYAQDGNDQVAFYDTPGNDVFTASPGTAQMQGPAGSNLLNIAVGFDTVRAYSQTGGYDKAYLTGSTGDDTFAAVGKPRTTSAGTGRLTGTGYFLEVYQFEEVYANLLTGNDTARLYDGSANDYFWAKLGAAVLTDGTVNDATGDLVTPGTYYYKVYGFDNAASDHVNLWGTSGGTNTKRVIAPLDYLLATYGSWIDAP